MNGVTVNRVRRGFYLDSVALMRLSQRLKALDDVEDAALMIGSPSNKQILDDAGLLDDVGRSAQANDLVIALRVARQSAAEAVLAEAEAFLERPALASNTASAWRPKSLASALQALPRANLALISVPGEYAALEARKALRAGLHVMLFSDNVSLDDECALKQEAQRRGLLMMGPDCGTALLGGVPLAFANAVPRGDIGIVAASGTGLQEVSCLIARGGKGVSHGIGVGGRDLSDAVGGTTSLMAIDALDRDPNTRHIVLISKPPSNSVAQSIMQRVANSRKPFTVCFIGLRRFDVPSNARAATTLQAAAEHALGARVAPTAANLPMPAGRRWIRGLYTGGTLCAEAQLVLSEGRLAGPLFSNAPIPGVQALHEGALGHILIDLGADEYTRGRPHPMLDPAARSEALRQVLRDPEVAVVLLDVVLGYGAHADPAAAVAEVIAAGPADKPAIVASVCGTDADPQGYTRQVRVLEQAGVVVAAANAQAAMLALPLS